MSQAAANAARQYISGLARELGIDPDSIPRPRYTNRRAPLSALKGVADIVAAEGGRNIPDGPMNVQEMRRQLRAVGIDLGHAAEDEADRADIARHEAGHAAVAHSLGWKVVAVDIGAGQTQLFPPDISVQSLRDRDRQHAAILAAGAAFAGTHDFSADIGADRANLRARSDLTWQEARKLAEALMDDRRIRARAERLTAALIKHGRLEGADLQRVLEGVR